MSKDGNLELFQQFVKTKQIEIEKNRNIVGYSRISSKQQYDNFSLAEQEQEIRNFARKNDYNLLQIFGGTYESASGDFTRKEFKQLYDWVTNSQPKPHAIAIKFINRFSRTGANAIGIVDNLVDRGIHLIETSTGLTTEVLKDRIEIYEKLCNYKKTYV